MMTSLLHRLIEDIIMEKTLIYCFAAATSAAACYSITRLCRAASRYTAERKRAEELPFVPPRG